MVNQMNGKLILTILTLFLLALLGLPRVIAHDLGWIEPGSLLNSLLVFVPPIIWIIVVLIKTNRPFLPLLCIGAMYGVILAVTHQILWFAAFDTPPELGGNLSNISPIANAIITRTFAFFSSVVTGGVIGIFVGLVGSVLNLLKGSR